MTQENEMSNAETLSTDCTLYSSLLKHIVQAAPNEDSSDYVLAVIGQNVGADRCCVYWFWDPGKTSMCTNTHEWCAEGIEPAIGGQQACNLADLVEFNACITSGRDFLFTDIKTIDPGSRNWLESQGIKSLIATPLVGVGGVILGFVGLDFVKMSCEAFTDRVVRSVHAAADILLICHRLHEGDMAVQDVMHGTDEYEKNEREFERALIELQKDANKSHPKHMLEIVRKRMDADICYIMQINPDSSGVVRPENLLIRSGWTNTRSWPLDADLGRVFDTRLKTASVVTFHDNEFDWIRANSDLEDSLPPSLANLKILHAFGIRKEGRLVGVLCVGYDDERYLSTPLADFMRRAALVIVTTLERISTYHDLAVALNLAHFRGDVVDFMFTHKSYAEIREFVGKKVRDITGAQHLMLCSADGSRRDWFGEDAPHCCHECAKVAIDMDKQLPPDFFSKGEVVIVPDGTTPPDMNLPYYCPMRSSVVSQFTKGDDCWRMVVDYTKQHSHNLIEVGRGLRVALELLAIAYERERHGKIIAMIQAQQRFRGDTLAYALSHDNIPGLIHLTMRRLLKLTACDFIAIHSIAGDHLMLYPDDELKQCPKRCEGCSFYKLLVPPVEDADHIIELSDTKRQSVAALPSDCPAKSLEVVVVYCEGKPWGGIALHYLNQQKRISEDDRRTLKIAANVLTLAIERHFAAIRLKEERDRVVEAEKSRSYFFSSVSHDIRTPLNAIIGFSELLEAGGVSSLDAKQYLKMIVSSGKTLLQLINDVLDLSKMDLGKLEFSYEPTDIGEVVREMVPMFEQMAKSRNQTIIAEVSDPRRFMVDPHRFRQVLFNFIGNAVKYAGSCTIRVSVSYANGVMTTTVADDGKGVSVEKAKRLMQPFVQADIKNRTEGSGLGLAICKRLVDLAHGTVSIETAPGKGFKIRTDVPVAVASEDANEDHAASVSVPASMSGRPSRILVVDDSPVNRAVLKAMLRKQGVTSVEFAENGKMALEKLERDSAFDLVMSDMWMPVMDGIELVKSIRANRRLAHLKVCSITADVEARMTYKEQGFDSFLLKPVTIDKLTEFFDNARDIRQEDA